MASPNPGHGHVRPLFQVLALLLLSVPQALGHKAELEVTLSPPVFSLLFYLVSLILWALHVTVCTSAEGSCYLCSLSWPAAGAVLMLISALLCAVLSALTEAVASGQLLSKVRQGLTGRFRLFPPALHSSG